MEPNHLTADGERIAAGMNLYVFEEVWTDGRSIGEPTVEVHVVEIGEHSVLVEDDKGDDQWVEPKWLVKNPQKDRPW